jgi:putative acetyltransferase
VNTPLAKIHWEQSGDAASIRFILCSAFPTTAEADLVDRLREAGHLAVSLIAERKTAAIGHVAFSPVVSEGDRDQPAGLGLAPLAVLPKWQGQGIGMALVTEGLNACRRLHCPFVVVLGEPAYYRRFGFRPASQFGIANEYGVDDPFMILELVPGTLSNVAGIVRYGPEFAGMAE